MKTRTKWPVNGPGKKRWVHEYGSGNRAAIVLLHEMSGVSPHLEKLANDLAAAGYRVLVPELLPFRSDPTNLVPLCLMRQFTVLASGRPSPIATWIRSFCNELAGNPPRPVAVIGMCATGGIVLSLLYEDAVSAGVVAQPSLPFRFGHRIITNCELGCAPDEVSLASASGKPVLALRFELDRWCPADRLESMRRAWDSGDQSENLRLVEFPGRGHSTLTLHRDCAVVNGQTSIQILIEWLGEKHPPNQPA